MPPAEKSVNTLVTNENLRSAGLLDPHQNVRAVTESTTEESFPDPPGETVQQAPRRPRGIEIHESTDKPPPLRADTDAHGKGKRPVYELMEPSTSDDEGICYATLLDHLPIPEDFFSRTNFFNLESSNFPVIGGSNSDSLYNLV